MMSIKAASIGGSILLLIALAITFIKTLIAFFGFITTAVQIIIVLAFVLVFGFVGYLIFRAWSDKKKHTD